MLIRSNGAAYPEPADQECVRIGVDGPRDSKLAPKSLHVCAIYRRSGNFRVVNFSGVYHVYQDIWEAATSEGPLSSVTV